MDVVNFVRMKDGTREDYVLIDALERDFASGTADRLLDALRGLEDSMGGYKVSRLEHSLQTATRAWKSGADDDWIVSALLHDLGDVLAPYNHDEYAATILRPFVREQCAWVVAHHAEFQNIYYAHFVGGDQHKRERHRGHIYFDDCVDFCEYWDQESFDPDYPTQPLEFFEPILRKVFARRAHDPQVLSPGLRRPIVNVADADARAPEPASPQG